jgi:hypothetical protein
VGTGETFKQGFGGASHADSQRMLTQRSINHDPGYAPNHITTILVQEHQTFVTRRDPFSARLCVAVAAMVESGYGNQAPLPF